MRRLFWVGAIVLLAAGSAWAQEPVMVPMNQSGTRGPDGFVVCYRPGSRAASSVSSPTGLESLHVQRVSVLENQTLQTLGAHLKAQPDVLWVQPNYWRYAQAERITPNDPYYRPERNMRQYQQWHLPKINADFAWSLTQGNPNIIVAVVDTGVDLNHPDLKSKLLPGITIINQTGYAPPSAGMDDNGHGTHVAGLIGASTNNNIGVAGCSWDVKILPVKVLGKDGAGTDTDIAAGIMWAADAGAKIINLSLGGASDDGTGPKVVQAAVDYAYAKGCIIFAASGNSGDNTVYFPAALPHVVAVAATDPYDRRSSYSTYGNFVALSAPGGSGKEALTKDTGMLSTFWNTNSSGSDTLGGSEAGEYAIEVGTSMAVAVVSGAAQLVWSQTPSLTGDQVVNILKSTAVDIGVPGPDAETGVGRIDVLAALGNPPVTQAALTLYNYPNPFNPEHETTQIVFLLDQPQDVELTIYDVARDRICQKRRTAHECVAGKNTFVWDGRNEQGNIVANGIYLMRIITDDGHASAIKGIAVLR